MRQLTMFSMMFWLTILLIMTLLMLLLLFYFWARRKQTYWSRRGVYSPPSHWFYGHVYEATTRNCTISQHLANICKDPRNQLAPVIGIYFFHKPYLLLRDPNLISQVLFKDFRYFTDRRFSINCQNEVIERANLYAIKNPQWRCLRMKLALAFDRNRQRALFRLILRSAQNMRQYLDRKLSIHGRIQIHAHNVSRRFIADTMVSLIFGVDTNSFQVPDTEIYKHSCGIYKTSKSRIWFSYISVLFPRLINSMFGTTITEHVDFFRNLFWKSMNEREKSGTKRGDFVDLLLELKNSASNNHFKFEGDWLFAQAMILIIAGLETSALTMSHTLLEIACDPLIQERVRQEIRDKIGFKVISFKLVSKMSYLESLVAETLRMYPPTSFINRVASQDYKISNSNIVIKKGTVVYISLRGLHLNPLYYPNPMKYEPDRFSKKNHSKIRLCTYMPFGDGPRMCIGSRIAFLQTMVGLITIMRNYTISSNVRNRERTSSPINDELYMIFQKSPIIDV